MMRSIGKYSKLIIAVLGIGASWLAEAALIPPGSEQVLITKAIEVMMLFGIVLTPAKGYDGQW